MSLVDHSHTTLGRDADMPEPRPRSYTGSSSDSCSPRSSVEASPITDSYDHDMIDGYRSDMMTSGPIKPSNRAPALPTKSARRASRFLNVTPAGSRSQSKTRTNPSATPYDLYLSSEEDASSSADDFSDFDFDSESEEPEEHKGHRRIRTITVTARVVTVVFAGKPSIVNLPARSRTSGSSEASGIRRAETEPNLTRRLSSTSSITSISMLQGHHSNGRAPTFIEHQSRPTFLNTDPFPTKAGEDIERPVTPLTPTSMFKRGMSLVKKRSRHQLSPGNFYTHSRENFSVQTLPVDAGEERQSRQQTDSPLEAKSPGYSYHDIMKTARRKALGLQESDTASLMSSNAANLSKLRSGFSLGRRRSIKS